MKCLITGGAGFLGSHLCDALVARGDEVWCLDNFFTGHHDNIAHLIDTPPFQLIEHDVVDPFDVEVDVICNLACPAAPGHYQFDPIKTLRTSVWGVHNAITLAHRLGATLVQASTSEVYGDPEEHPQNESYVGHVNPIGIRACYDEGKRAAETMLMDASRTMDLDVRIIRIFNTYGPRMHPWDGRVVSNFIRQALAGDPLTLFGDGLQTRSFCFVSDLIDGILKVVDTPEASPGPINLGNPSECTMLQLAQTIQSAVGGPPEINWMELPADDPKKRQPDITRASEILGWSPAVALGDGIRETVAYFQRLDMSRFHPPTPAVAGGGPPASSSQGGPGSTA